MHSLLILLETVGLTDLLILLSVGHVRLCASMLQRGLGAFLYSGINYGCAARTGGEANGGC